ncbi:MAG: endonuclease/exonuclease/phosphatase family protein [Treponemataceae bacterium]
MRILLIAATCVVLAACGGCETGNGARGTGASADRLTVATWNVQALFDGRDDGTEYADYSGSSGWTDEKYRERLKKIGQAVALMAEGGPDVLVLIETENATVAEDLAAGPLSGLGYGWSARAKNAGAALGLSVYSRYPIVKTLVHGVNARGEEAPRPVLEVRVDTGSAPLVVIACHWKSKLGGDDATEYLRRASGAVVSRRLAQLEKEEPGIDVVVVGDLNENVDEFGRRGGQTVTALLPDSPDASRAAAADTDGVEMRPFLIISQKKPPVAEHVRNCAAVYSPWPFSSWTGSYAYRKQWETIDHVLANAALFNGQGWEYASFRVIDAEPLTDASDFPVSYNARTGSGYSDHLPLAVELSRVR